MPSGAKKRKAAKKKKEQQANHQQGNSNSNSPLGNDDPKSQDERESDGGEAGSPASQDHHNHQHPFQEGNGELEKRDPTPVRSSDSERKSMAEVAQGLEDAVNIGREVKTEDDSGSQSINIRHVEFVKESHGGSSSSSSSDNESQVCEKRAASHNGENNPADLFPKEVIQGNEKASLVEADNSAVETAPTGHSVEPLITESEEVIHVTQGDLVEISAVPDVVESLKENKESKRNEEKGNPFVEDNNGTSPTVVETVTNENEGKILPTSVTPTDEISNVGESTRDSKIPDCSENQPFIASAPRVEQRTSWMSCCGLFDVLTCSSR
ncbi:hypothetical protein KPL70_005314 [Citrus sinensis]|uniref:uncharacterized protein LOC102611722 isoform X1 n=1 Tax=Citrus sinensis TaxID=2711 RepID=UPI0003D715D7|nr:uncharacterized protein LOC102611722 isoform X1 [Citrus sinensis]KAH9749263.1 hypothetical protein KPL70_005314 [Citrus sinensis]